MRRLLKTNRLPISTAWTEAGCSLPQMPVIWSDVSWIHWDRVERGDSRAARESLWNQQAAISLFLPEDGQGDSTERGIDWFLFPPACPSGQFQFWHCKWKWLILRGWSQRQWGEGGQSLRLNVGVSSVVTFLTEVLAHPPKFFQPKPNWVALLVR